MARTRNPLEAKVGLLAPTLFVESAAVREHYGASALAIDVGADVSPIARRERDRWLRRGQHALSGRQDEDSMPSHRQGSVHTTVR